MTASHSSVSYLFLQLKNGDQNARSQLVVRMQERLKRLTASILYKFPKLQRKLDIDDVLNDLNARLLGAIDAGVHPEGSTEFLKFAGFKLHQLLKDEANKCKRRGDDPLPLDPAGDSGARAFEPGTDTHNPEQLAQWADFWDKVNALPDDERTVFVMHYVLQVTQADIAEELGEHPRQIARRWLKATTKLQNYLPKFAAPSVG